MEHNQCRLCLLPISKHRILNLFQNNSKFNIVELIDKLFNIVITEDDSFSKIICYTCFVTLDNFNNYSVKVVLNNNYLIQNYCAASNIKIKENEETSDIINDCLDNQVTENFDTNECMNIKCEIEQTSAINDENNDDEDDDDDDNHDESSCDKESENITENISNVEPQVILEESQDSSDTEIYTAKRKKRAIKHTISQKYPETPNDIQIKKFYKYECDLCKDHPEISTFRLLKLHYKSKHGIAAYIKCCGKKFTRPYALVEHIDEHLTPESLICPTCNKKLRTKQTLLLHMDMHVPIEQRPLKCKYCDMRFVRNHFLHQHEKVHLSDDQLKYICDLCGKRFPTDWRLKTHLNSTHSDEKPFVCEVCAKAFKLKVQLQNHMFVHNSKEEAHKQCEHCGVWLRSPRSYYVHMKEKHDESAPKSFPCDKCSHVSPTRKALYAHSINKHGPKKHNCVYCTEAFSSSNLLKSHMIKHTGPGEPLKCPFCPKSFSFRSGYYSHKKKVHPNVTEPHKANST